MPVIYWLGKYGNFKYYNSSLYYIKFQYLFFVAFEVNILSILIKILQPECKTWQTNRKYYLFVCFISIVRINMEFTHTNTHSHHNAGLVFI